MSILTIHVVRCDQCGAEAERASSKREALELAKEEGFVRKRVQNGSMWDFCEKCKRKNLTNGR